MSRVKYCKACFNSIAANETRCSDCGVATTATEVAAGQQVIVECDLTNRSMLETEKKKSEENKRYQINYIIFLTPCCE